MSSCNFRIFFFIQVSQYMLVEVDTILWSKLISSGDSGFNFSQSLPTWSIANNYQSYSPKHLKNIRLPIPRTAACKMKYRNIFHSTKTAAPHDHGPLYLGHTAVVDHTGLVISQLVRITFVLNHCAIILAPFKDLVYKEYLKTYLYLKAVSQSFPFPEFSELGRGFERCLVIDVFHLELPGAGSSDLMKSPSYDLDQDFFKLWNLLAKKVFPLVAPDQESTLQ